MKHIPALTLIIIVMLITTSCTQSSSDLDAISFEPSKENVSYSLDEVSMHSVKGDCWLAIHGKVYDISKFNSHPGGSAILEGCGKDATELFETRPMGSKTPHSQNAKKLLDKYYIGNLE